MTTRNLLLEGLRIKLKSLGRIPGFTGSSSSLAWWKSFLKMNILCLSWLNLTDIPHNADFHKILDLVHVKYILSKGGLILNLTFSYGRNSWFGGSLLPLKEVCWFGGSFLPFGGYFQSCEGTWSTKIYMWTRTNEFLTKSKASYDKIGLNLKFQRAFVLVLENTLGQLAVTHWKRNTTTNNHMYLQRCPDGRVV